nr:MAG TPA: hypothetical protein [Caudoviricetes sp.]
MQIWVPEWEQVVRIRFPLFCTNGLKRKKSKPGVTGGGRSSFRVPVKTEMVAAQGDCRRALT